MLSIHLGVLITNSHVRRKYKLMNSYYDHDHHHHHDDRMYVSAVQPPSI